MIPSDLRPRSSFFVYLREIICFWRARPFAALDHTYRQFVEFHACVAVALHTSKVVRPLEMANTKSVLEFHLDSDSFLFFCFPLNALPDGHSCTHVRHTTTCAVLARCPLRMESSFVVAGKFDRGAAVRHTKIVIANDIKKVRAAAVKLFCVCLGSKQRSCPHAVAAH